MQKKPTGFNALMVPLIYEARLRNALKITIEENNGHSNIYYDTTNNGQEINILKVTGPMKNYSEEELKNIIKNSRQAVASLIEEITEDVLKQTLQANSDEKMDVSEKLGTFLQNSSRKEQKAFLTKIFQELSEEKENRINQGHIDQAQKKDEPLTLSKKKKDNK